ncbi:uncharacterized protein LOC113749549 isoform X2 [Coffea eugenioides]|uniref:uncharacterized protein LOC113749529 isoform X2 n=1 Tax=Coffea eugenioides TaxID=49369 RepID=UPI000F6070A4|nr:uncharacterized protein LOC113749529 isoform X2 [Coffea eugenioides]XP_027149128.1 uncharacterized protein LOC113749549 isoform X2 [Coffea eugenioides]
MAKAKGSNDSWDREKCNKIFNAMVHLLQNQQTQIQYLAKDRKLLEDIVKLQHERWTSDVNLLKEHIFQMRRDLTMQEKERIVEATKADMVMGLKLRESFLYKQKFDSELADFREWFERLARKCSEKDTSADVIKKGEEHRYKALESNLKRLQCENEKLMLDKNSEISALLAEKNFVWNQYNLMETNLNEQLRQKCADVESANEKIWGLLSSMEDMQSSNSVKDRMIARLNDDIARLRSDLVKNDEEVSRLSRELEALRRLRKDSMTPVLGRCTTESGNTNSKAKSGMTVTTKKELDSSLTLEKGCKSSKRKAVDTIQASNTPKLFTSSFKVPKLKNSSPAVH